MSRLLAQSINVAGLVDGQRNGHQQCKGSGKSTRSSVKTKCHTLGASGLRMSGFSSGLRTVNDPLDTNTIMLRPLQAFYSRRPSKWVAKALSEKFTDEAFKVLMLAQEEAKRLGHTYVGTEQILLGLIGEGTGIASKVLKSKIGIKLKDARLQVEKIIGRGYGYVGVEIPFTPQAKHVLKLSLQEARQLEDDYIGSEHLLLSLLNEREGVAARALQKLGADPADIRIQIYREIVSGSKW